MFIYVFFPKLRDLSFGCAVDVTGNLKKSPSKKQNVELHASRIDVVGECNPVVNFLSYYLIYFIHLF